MPAGMGTGAITQDEIYKWQCNTGIELNAWESQTLRYLSQAHTAMCQAAQDPQCKSPLGPSDDDKKQQSQRLQKNIDLFLA